MVSSIIKWLLIACVAGAIIMWILSGGIGRIITAAKNHSFAITNPFSFIFSENSFSSIKLPGAPALPRGPDISSLTDGQGESALDSGSAALRSDTPTGTYEQDFGNPSPYRGSISLRTDGAATNDPRAQFVTLSAETSATGVVSLSKWSLQSAVTGQRAYFPRGASLFTQGAVNAESDIALSPGMTAIVSTGVSPVGVSFRVNGCSSYLAQMQSFTPGLTAWCPATGVETIGARSYGTACAAYVSSIPACTIVTSVPSQVGSACTMFVLDEFSYNGCVREHRSDNGFLGSEWRIYLGATRALWKSDHDVIRLLDESGRTVDVASY